MTGRARRGGRARKVKGDQGEREVLVLLEKAGWIVNNGASCWSGVDLTGYIACETWPESKGACCEGGLDTFHILHAEVKNERWGHRGRRYLGPVSAHWERQGVLYRVFTHEDEGWVVRRVEYRDGQCRTVYRAPATVPNLTVGGLLTGSLSRPSTPAPKEAEG